LRSSKLADGTFGGDNAREPSRPASIVTPGSPAASSVTSSAGPVYVPSPFQSIWTFGV
jgi:hypothetical protein